LKSLFPSQQFRFLGVYFASINGYSRQDPLCRKKIPSKSAPTIAKLGVPARMRNKEKIKLKKFMATGNFTDHFRLTD
jgi:hypothetical protein